MKVSRSHHVNTSVQSRYCVACFQLIKNQINVWERCISVDIVIVPYCVIFTYTASFSGSAGLFSSMHSVLRRTTISRSEPNENGNSVFVTSGKFCFCSQHETS
ncbi:hypothetical protein AMECASPLE_010309 [Ameca splendens]|uniref:Uncharacterized protein n=1 Tax=Ameca splendens TaxID=208324 RepID=A0ABV0YMS1_9TELE